MGLILLLSFKNFIKFSIKSIYENTFHRKLNKIATCFSFENKEIFMGKLILWHTDFYGSEAAGDL